MCSSGSQKTLQHTFEFKYKYIHYITYTSIYLFSQRKWLIGHAYQSAPFILRNQAGQCWTHRSFSVLQLLLRLEIHGICPPPRRKSNNNAVESSAICRATMPCDDRYSGSARDISSRATMLASPPAVACRGMGRKGWCPKIPGFTHQKYPKNMCLKKNVVILGVLDGGTWLSIAQLFGFGKGA